MNRQDQPENGSQRTVGFGTVFWTENDGNVGGSRRPLTPTMPPFSGMSRFPGSCRSFMQSYRLPKDSEEPIESSDFGALGQGQRIIDVHAEVPDGVLDVGMPEQNLDGSQVPGRLVDK